MKYQAAESFLFGLPRFAVVGAPAYKPGLHRINALLECMGRPQDAWASIHVAGTNGKGSTASMIAAVGATLGFRTGLHTSPHLLHLGERMRVNGVPAPEEWIAGAVDRHRIDFERIGASFFEATTALSFLYFAEMGVDLAVVEVGMGGRFDATNVILPRVSVITHINFDHEAFLGSTLAEIAAEKSGIVKNRTPVVLAPSPAEVFGAVDAAAKRVEAPLHLIEEEVHLSEVRAELTHCTFSARTPRREYRGLRLAGGGLHQVENASLALRAAEIAWPENEVLPAAVYSAFNQFVSLTGLRGRMEILRREPLLVADVAHNADGIGRVVDAIVNAFRPREGRLHVVLGLMADKDAAAVADLLAALDASVYCVEMDVERAFPAEELSRRVSESGVDVAASGPLDVVLGVALEAARPGDAVLVTGSHMLVGDLLAES